MKNILEVTNMPNMSKSINVLNISKNFSSISALDKLKTYINLSNLSYGIWALYAKSAMYPLPNYHTHILNTSVEHLLTAFLYNFSQQIKTWLTKFRYNQQWHMLHKWQEQPCANALYRRHCHLNYHNYILVSLSLHRCSVQNTLK